MLDLFNLLAMLGLAGTGTLYLMSYSKFKKSKSDLILGILTWIAALGYIAQIIFRHLI
jgi:hypothetical protein